MSKKQVKQVKQEPKCSNRNWLIFWALFGVAVIGTVGVKVYQLNPIPTTITVAPVTLAPTPKCGLAKENAYMRGYTDGYDQR